MNSQGSFMENNSQRRGLGNAGWWGWSGKAFLIRRYLHRHLSRPEAIWANTFQVEKTSAKDQARARSQKEETISNNIKKGTGSRSWRALSALVRILSFILNERKSLRVCRERWHDVIMFKIITLAAVWRIRWHDEQQKEAGCLLGSFFSNPDSRWWWFGPKILNWLHVRELVIGTKDWRKDSHSGIF